MNAPVSTASSKCVLPCTTEGGKHGNREEASPEFLLEGIVSQEAERPAPMPAEPVTGSELPNGELPLVELPVEELHSVEEGLTVPETGFPLSTAAEAEEVVTAVTGTEVAEATKVPELPEKVEVTKEALTPERPVAHKDNVDLKRHVLREEPLRENNQETGEAEQETTTAISAEEPVAGIVLEARQNREEFLVIDKEQLKDAAGLDGTQRAWLPIAVENESPVMTRDAGFAEQDLSIKSAAQIPVVTSLLRPMLLRHRLEHGQATEKIELQLRGMGERQRKLAKALREDEHKPKATVPAIETQPPMSQNERPVPVQVTSRTASTVAEIADIVRTSMEQMTFRGAHAETIAATMPDGSRIVMRLMQRRKGIEVRLQGGPRERGEDFRRSMELLKHELQGMGVSLQARF